MAKSNNEATTTNTPKIQLAQRSVKQTKGGWKNLTWGRTSNRNNLRTNPLYSKLFGNRTATSTMLGGSLSSKIKK